MRLALMQLTPAAGEAATVTESAAACREAKSAGADLALFPEMWNDGYRFFDPDRDGARSDWQRSAHSVESAFVRGFGELAKELDMAIGLGFLEATPEAPRNAFVLFDRKGHPVLHYAKVHTCLHTLERYCDHGTDLPVAELETAAGAVTVGAMICYDREHPETARILALKGAEIILVPNACVLDELRIAQVRVRAFENKVAIALANYPSTAGHSNGHSMGVSAIAFANDGTPRDRNAPEQSVAIDNRRVEAGSEPGIHVFDLDMAAERAYRRRAIWGAPHRRPDAYAGLVEPNHQLGVAIDDPIS